MEQLIVAVIVLGAAWFVAGRLLPRKLRAAVRGSAWRAARALGWNRLARRLDRAVPAVPAGACDSCDACDGCAPHPAGEFGVQPIAPPRSTRPRA